MTRTISFISIIGAALVLAAPAFGKGERFEQTPQWKQALEARSEALNQQHGLGRYATVVPPSRLTESIASREGMERAMLQAERRYDFFQDAGLAGVDTRAELRRASHSAITSGPDAFERAAIAGTTGTVPVVADDRFRIDPTASSGSVEATSGRDIEWSQVAIGLGIGLLLGLGLVLAVRYTRIRPLAH